MISTQPNTSNTMQMPDQTAPVISASFKVGSARQLMNSYRFRYSIIGAIYFLSVQSQL